MTSTINEGVSRPASRRGLVLATIPLGIVLNLGIGTIATTLKLPVYVDAIGTILMTILLGMRAGVVVGVLSFLIGGILTNPALPYFCGTQACIAIFIGLMARYGALHTLWGRIGIGILLGIIAAIVSAPVIVYLFGGITGSGVSVVTAFMIASGKSVLKSVVLAGAAAEPIDKTIQVLIACWILRGLPKSLLKKYSSTGYLVRNDFITARE